MKNKNMPALIGTLALLAVLPAGAALYRCGNVFQDRPCEAVAPQEAARPPQAGSSAALPARRPASGPAAEAAEPMTATREEVPAAKPAASAAATARKGPPSLACPNLREQRAAIEARLQAGGRPETVRMYQRQKGEVERNLGEGNCL